MNKVYLLLGSNIGDSKKHLTTSKNIISKRIGTIIRSSAIYSTAAWGKKDQPDFLNQIIILTTKLNSISTMNTILDIEKVMGRFRTEKNAPRIIDIDILFFNKEITDSNLLKVPHPLMQERNFVMVPLNELSPNFKHPVLKKSIHKLLLVCKDRLSVNKI